MTVTTFDKIIRIFLATFSNFKFKMDDDFMVEIWYNELAYMDDAKAVLAAKKVISTCDFVTIKNIKQAYADMDTPVQVDDSEGWGLVERAIRMYGYMRADEAIASLPSQVQRAVQYMGGFKTICEAENKEVIRGQFTRAMAAVNQRQKVNATLGQPLLDKITQYKLAAEQEQNKALIQQEQNKMLENTTKANTQENNVHIANIRQIINKIIGNEACANEC